MSKTQQAQRRWPIVLAAAGVVVLFLVMIAVDWGLARRVAARTSEILLDTQRGIELVSDIHHQVDRLIRAGNSAAEILAITNRIQTDSRDYDQLASSPEEKQEWNQLRAQLVALESQVAKGETDLISQHRSEISRRIEGLVEINKRASREQATAIDVLHTKAIWVDGFVGGVTVLLVLVIVLVLFRVLSRERALTLEHIELLAEHNRDLDAFAGRAAHDLQVPLSPIRGYADLILTEADSPEVRQMASRIRVAVDRMSKVIHDMLELSRAGRPSPGNASPADVISAVLEELAGALGGAEVRIRVTDERVACTPNLLAQILSNLVSNAIKFRSASRPLVVAITAELRGAEVEITVEDNGMGIQEEEAAHVFEPFFRARTEREVPGYGLGLAIAHRAATALGGSCNMERAPSGGTRITVRLPRATSERPSRSFDVPVGKEIRRA